MKAQSRREGGMGRGKGEDRRGGGNEEGKREGGRGGLVCIDRGSPSGFRGWEIHAYPV